MPPRPKRAAAAAAADAAALTPRKRTASVGPTTPATIPRPLPPAAAEAAAPWTRSSLAAAAAALAATHPALAAAVETVGVPYDALLPKRGGGDAHFATLARSIVAQQISAAAARTITARLVDVAGGELTPGRVLGVEEQALRGAGLSERKASYITDLAAAFATRGLAAAIDAAAAAGDAAAVAAALTAVRGVGPWSADMHAIFHLGLRDVMPAGDLGVRKGVARVFGVPAAPSPPPPARVLALTAGWAPHRSLAAYYMWRLPEAW